MVEDFIKDIEYADSIEIKTEKATDFIRTELIEKANKIFDRKMETYEEAVNEAKEKLLENKSFIKRHKKVKLKRDISLFLFHLKKVYAEYFIKNL